MNVRATRPLTMAALLSSGALLYGATTLAAAQTTSPPGWQYEFTPYLWGAGTDGTTRVRSIDGSSTASFSDVFTPIDFGLAGTFEARKDRWSILADGIYIKLSNSETNASSRINADITPQQYSLAGTYRVAPGPVPVDLLGGARYIDVQVDLETGRATRTGNATLWHPFVGARTLIPLTDRWTLLGYGDVGGLSGDSSWQLIGGVNYQFSQRFSGKFGYRHLHMNIDKNTLDFDMAISGFYAGVGIRF